MSEGVTPRERVRHPTGGTKRVKQSDREGADINTKVQRWIRSGVTDGTVKVARYGDFSGIGDFQTCLSRVVSAEEDFMRLPSHVRQACDNDPGQFLEKVFNAEDRDALVDMGLLEKDLPPAIQRVEVVNPDPPKEPAGD